MFKLSPISSHTGAHPSTPLVHCLVDDVLLALSGNSRINCLNPKPLIFFV